MGYIGGTIYLRDDFSHMMAASHLSGSGQFEYDGAYDYLTQVAETGKTVSISASVLGEGLLLRISSCITIYKQKSGSNDSVVLEALNKRFVVSKEKPNTVIAGTGG